MCTIMNYPHANNDVCPGCGRCRQCGQISPFQIYPPYPGPYVWPYPIWITSIDTSGSVSTGVPPEFRLEPEGDASERDE
jgi:hypothetical protein